LGLLLLQQDTLSEDISLEDPELLELEGLDQSSLKVHQPVQ
jgi:hypothetical protein